MQIRPRTFRETTSFSVKSKTTGYGRWSVFPVCLLAYVGGYKLTAQMVSGSANVSSGDFRCQFGLSKAMIADVTVCWPAGEG